MENMGTQKRVLVTGAGGFIGHHLVKRLKSDGHWVRGVDLKYPEYEATQSDAFEILDLRRADNCLLATRGGIDEVYNLAADMGGIGYITAYLADISRNNIFIKRTRFVSRKGFASIMSTGRVARTKVEKKRPPPLSVGRSL